MPRFIIERNFAEQLELSRDDVNCGSAGRYGPGRTVAVLVPQCR